MPKLSKQERLYEQRLIELLFSRGGTIYAGGKPASLKVRYLLIDPDPDYPSNTAYPCKLMVNASKRHFKHAVQRNRIKRLLREAYRARKAEFEALIPRSQENGARTQTLLLSLQYMGEEGIGFKEMEALVEELWRAGLQSRVLNIARVTPIPRPE